MALVDVKEIIEAGVHFGHRASRWHPKMRPFIFGKRNLIHIVDVRETIKGLVRGSNFLRQLAATGKDVVYVGTKRQAKSLIMREAQRAGMHWISERWLGGTLTNFHTIRSRLKRLEELEALEQDGTIERYSKKRISALRRERRKILRNLDGLRKMKELPGCLIVVDIRSEHIAVKEARKMGIPVVALVDTDSDPKDVDIVIPGNDDAYRSIQIVLRVLTDAIIAGRDKYVVSQAEMRRAQEAEAGAAAKRSTAERRPPIDRGPPVQKNGAQRAAAATGARRKGPSPVGRTEPPSAERPPAREDSSPRGDGVPAPSSSSSSDSGTSDSSPAKSGGASDPGVTGRQTPPGETAPEEPNAGADQSHSSVDKTTAAP